MDIRDSGQAERPMGLTTDGQKEDSISNNFRHHRPGEGIERKHDMVRGILGSVARDMDQMLPHGREAALVQTKLEEAMFWAGAAISRNQT